MVRCCGLLAILHGFGVTRAPILLESQQFVRYAGVLYVAEIVEENTMQGNPLADRRHALGGHRSVASGSDGFRQLRQ